jgi:Nuclear pore complex scaffold, nucleoporins 186/192/205
LGFYILFESSTRKTLFLLCSLEWFLCSGGTQLGTVSWEHFFTSLNQYYASLRQEVPQTAYPGFVRGTTFRSHGAQMAAIRSITPQEVDGLRAVLTLVATVVKQVSHLLYCKPCVTYVTLLFAGMALEVIHFFEN